MNIILDRKRCFLIVFVTVLSLSGCSQKMVQVIDETLDFENRVELYELDEWGFSGRFSASSQNDSVSASIKWQHADENDFLDISGPLGQGRTNIILNPNQVIIDNGEEQQVFFENIEFVVQRELGLEIPVIALRYWVLGLIHPGFDYTLIENGFAQNGWKVQYSDLQWASDLLMPKKIKIIKGNVYLKLIVDSWALERDRKEFSENEKNYRF